MKNSFVVQYAVNLWLVSAGANGFFALFIGKIAAWILGELLDKGIVEIDITIDKLKQALKDPQWREAALKAYKHASARVYTEAEKDAIRKSYMDALKNYAAFVDSMSNDENTKY